MNWLALSPWEAAAVWAALGGVALWLYLHHRRPQRRRVSTLRFWASVQPVSQPRRRKLREPLAYAMQALFLLLLVLALANLRWGSVYDARSVAMILDASVWSQAHPDGQDAWVDRVRAEALRVLDGLPAGDRVLLLRAEANTPPILPFTSDRAALRRAIQNVQPSSVVADLPRVLVEGRAALGGGRRGVLVYVGPGLVSPDESRALDELRTEIESPEPGSVQPQLVMRLVGDWDSLQNRGITRLSLRRDAAQPDRWRLLTQLKNYAKDKADVTLALSVNGQRIGQRKVSLAPQALTSTQDEFTWDQGGMLQAELAPTDALAADDRATVNIPTFRTVRVGVFTNASAPLSGDLLDVLSSDPYVQARVLPPELSAAFAPDIAVYQGAEAAAQPEFNSIYFLSAAPVAGARPVRVTNWNPQHPVTRWVRTRDISVRNPATLTVQSGDSVLAYAEGNPPQPLILAREKDGRRVLIIGFNPHDSNFPLESAFPLLMAGSVEWMTHSVDEVADSRATGEIDFPGPATKVVSPSGKEVPFARKGADITWLALETGIYKVASPSGETSVAVNSPALPAERVQLTAAETAGVDPENIPPAAWNMWRWLTLLAIAALWLEWWLYYRARERQRAAEAVDASGASGASGTGAAGIDLEPPAPEENEFRSRNFASR